MLTSLFIVLHIEPRRGGWPLAGGNAKEIIWWGKIIVSLTTTT